MQKCDEPQSWTLFDICHGRGHIRVIGEGLTHNHGQINDHGLDHGQSWSNLLSAVKFKSSTYLLTHWPRAVWGTRAPNSTETADDQLSRKERQKIECGENVCCTECDISVPRIVHFFGGIGTGIGKNWYRKKVSKPVSEKFVTGKKYRNR